MMLCNIVKSEKIQFASQHLFFPPSFSDDFQRFTVDYFCFFLDPSVIQHLLRKTVNVGKKTCLSCKLYATRDKDTVVSWYKNGVLLTPDNMHFGITTNAKDDFDKFWSHLCIKSVEISDHGEYACGVVGHKLAKGELIVYGKYFMQYHCIKSQWII